jgi:Family of unknown function (DUF6230)
VNDAQREPAYGRTDWRRFAVAVGVPAVVAAGIVVGMANGAFAAQFAVSGQEFKIAAAELDGTGFVQYGSSLKDAQGVPRPVAMSGIKHAKLYKLCQSVKLKGLPISLVIHAGDDANNKAEADDLLIGVKNLGGNATFKKMTIGQDASTLTAGGDDAHGAVGAFGQQADSVVITDLKQSALSTTASSFTLNGLNLHLDVATDGNPEECY